MKTCFPESRSIPTPCQECPNSCGTGSFRSRNGIEASASAASAVILCGTQTTKEAGVMSTVEEGVAVAGVPRGGDDLRRNWPWFVLLGVALTAVGFIALWSPWVASLATAVVIGSLLLAAGAVEIVGSFWSRRWSG